MVRRALPEGVLEPNGQVTGFVYFEELRDVPSATLRFTPLDAATNTSFGTLTVAFVADE